MVTRAALLVAIVTLALAGCRPDEELASADLSSASLYCPSDPPLTTPFVCDLNAIPYCTYPTQQVTCTCTMGADGVYLLQCAAVPTDGGVATD